MGFKEVSSLDADIVVSIGKRDRKTGNQGPKQAEGYYLGSRQVKSNRGESFIHFLQTPEGNLGVWGTTDMNRKLKQVPPGTMVRITSTGTRPTPNGDMYTYKVELDKENTIEVGSTEVYETSESQDSEYSSDESYNSYDSDEAEDDLSISVANANVGASAATRKARVAAILNSKNKSAKTN